MIETCRRSKVKIPVGLCCVCYPRVLQITITHLNLLGTSCIFRWEKWDVPTPGIDKANPCNLALKQMQKRSMCHTRSDCKDLLEVEQLRLIYTYDAVPLPCRSAKGLDCVFPIWFTQCGRVWFTHAMPFPCHDTNMPFWKRPLKATAWERHGMCELASAVLRRHVGDLPAFGEWQVRGRVAAGERHGMCESGCEVQCTVRSCPAPFVQRGFDSTWWKMVN
jgi:hypothetical protein